MSGDVRLQALIDAHLDGTLSTADAAELSAWLERSPEAREFFWRHTAVHGLLPRASQQEWLDAPPVAAAVHPRRGWIAGGLAAAAAIAAAVWFFPKGNATAGDAEPPIRGVAAVSRVAGVEWDDPAAVPAVGAVLAPGWLRLKAGLVQIEFFSGASLVVQGPAELEVRSAREAFVRSGSVSAEVPEPARGFVVDSPGLRLVDLGTAFGMSVASGGNTEVFVQRGLVRVTRAGTRTEPQELREGQGVRVDVRGEVQTMAARADFPTVAELVRRQQVEAKARLAKWRVADRDLRRDPAALVHFDFEAQVPGERVLPNGATNSVASAAGTLVGCQWTTGRWPDKGALEFRSVGDRVRLVVPGEMTALTFSAWLRPDSLAHRYNALLVADSYRRGVLRWQLTQQGALALTQLLVDDQSLSDPASAQRVISEGAIPPQRLGRWTHVATTVDFRTGEVVHYADGRRVGAGRFAVLVAGRIGNAELGNWGITPETERGRRLVDGGYVDRAFVGRIDEFELLARALSGDEVRARFEAGRVDLANLASLTQPPQKN